MAKGRYSIVHGQEQLQPTTATVDRSFYSCIFTILGCTLFFLIILITPFVINSIRFRGNAPRDFNDTNEKGISFSLRGDGGYDVYLPSSETKHAVQTTPITPSDKTTAETTTSLNWSKINDTISSSSSEVTQSTETQTSAQSSFAVKLITNLYSQLDISIDLTTTTESTTVEEKVTELNTLNDSANIGSTKFSTAIKDFSENSSTLIDLTTTSNTINQTNNDVDLTTSSVEYQTKESTIDTSTEPFYTTDVSKDYELLTTVEKISVKSEKLVNTDYGTSTFETSTSNYESTYHDIRQPTTETSATESTTVTEFTTETITTESTTEALEVNETTMSSSTPIKEDIIVPTTIVSPSHELNCSTTTVRAENISTQPEPVLCKSNLCKAEASRILSYMNYSVDYCRDFYELACGEMRHSNTILEDNPETYLYHVLKDEVGKIENSRNQSERGFKDFYLSCLNHDNVPLTERKMKGKALLNAVGTMVKGEDGITDLTDIVVKLIQLNSFPIFDISLDVDEDNTTQLQLKISIPLQDFILKADDSKAQECRKLIRKQTDHTTKLAQIYENSYLRCMKNHSVYIRTVGEALECFQVFNNSENSLARIQEVLMTVEDKLLRLKEKLPSAGTISEVLSTKAKDFITVEELQTKLPVINWEELFLKLLKQSVDEHTSVIIYFKAYFEDIFSFLSNTKDLWKIHNALLANYAFNVYKHLVNNENFCQREEYCMKITTQLLPDVATNLFLNSFDKNILTNKYKEEQKIMILFDVFFYSFDINIIENMSPKHFWRYDYVTFLYLFELAKCAGGRKLDKAYLVMELFEMIRKTMLEEVKEATWMDEMSSEAVVLKTKALQLSLPSLFDSHRLDEQFDKLNITNLDFISNSIELLKRKKELLYEMYDMDPKSDYVLWTLFAMPCDYNSLYMYELNTLVVPALILVKYEKNLPASLNMAKVGHILARGFGRAFDKTGIMLNHKNHRVNLLTEQSYMTFDTTLYTAAGLFSFLLSHQENGIYYEISLTDTLSINERLSDVSATKLTLETLRRLPDNITEVLLWGDFSEEQLYFITLAQTFCQKKTVEDVFPDLFEKDTLPPFLRIRSMFSNLKDFNISFPCIIGSTMNSLVKIDPFPLLTEE